MIRVFILILILIVFTTSLFSVPYKEGFINSDVVEGGFIYHNGYFYYHDFSGLNIVDISNPEEPEIVGSVNHLIFPGDFGEGFSTFKIYNNHLVCHYYFIMDCGFESTTYYDTFIFDISDPFNPILIFNIYQNNLVPLLFVDNGFIYEYTRFHILNKYSIPDHNFLGNVDLNYVGDNLADMEIHNNILFVLKYLAPNTQLRIYDMVNIDNPILVDEVDLPYDKITIENQILYNYCITHYLTPSYLEIFNISNLYNLVNIGQKQFYYGISRFHVNNDQLYLQQNKSIIIYDASNPSDVIKISDVEGHFGYYCFYNTNNDYLFVNSNFYEQGIDIINICDLNNNLYEFYEIFRVNKCIELYENRLFIGCSSHLDLYDINNEPILTWSDSTITSPNDIEPFNNYIFVLEGGDFSQSSLRVYEYLDQYNLDLVFQNEAITSQYMTIEEDYLFILEPYHWYVHPTIRVFSITDPTNPIEICGYDKGDLQVTSADRDDNILAVSYDDNENSRVIFYDISEPLNISEINSVYSIGSCENVVLDNGVCFLSDGLEGIQIIDMQNFEIVANIKPNDDTYVEDKVCLIDNYLIFEDLTWSELFCYDISSLTNPIFIECIKFNKYIKEMRYYNGNIYGVTQLGLLVMDDQITSVDDVSALNSTVDITNYPNPFNPSTTIEFIINNNSKIELSIFNIKGQKIKTLANSEFQQGSHSIIWKGNDESGKSVSSGIYYYQLNINGKTEAVKKCLLLK